MPHGTGGVPMNNKKEYVRQRSVWIDGEILTIPQPEYNILQNQMFVKIWNEREHKCAISNKPLGNEPLSYYFHHILEKRNYEHFALCKWNIIILNYEVHNMYETKPDTQPLLMELREELIIQLDTYKYEFDNDVIYTPCRNPSNHLFDVIGRTVFEKSMT